MSKQLHRKLFLKRNEERRIKAGHLWIYSNEIDSNRSPLKSFYSGELVNIFSHSERCLGSAYINPHSLISARIISSKPDAIIDEDFILARIESALALRERLYQYSYYRLVYAESDGLPGLIVDRFDNLLIIQVNTAGMEPHTDLVATILRDRLPVSTIILKNDSPARAQEGLELYSKTIFGTAPDYLSVTENNLDFVCPLFSDSATSLPPNNNHNDEQASPNGQILDKPEFIGQKTGWFYDHRMSRIRLCDYVQDRSVLDVFSYVGAWGIQAAKAGAQSVTCIDSSRHAMEYVRKNALLNQLSDRINSLRGDAFQELRRLLKEGKKFDVIVLDPPALIKRKKDSVKGIEAYKQLNRLAMELLNRDGILVSCSCSYHLSEHALQDILLKCSRKLGKQLQILERGQQSPDHPVHAAIAETAYIKTFFVRLMN